MESKLQRSEELSSQREDVHDMDRDGGPPDFFDGAIDNGRLTYLLIIFLSKPKAPNINLNQ